MVKTHSPFRFPYVKEKFVSQQTELRFSWRGFGCATFYFMEVETMKKAIIILLALVMVLSLAACGGNSDKEKLLGYWMKTKKPYTWYDYGYLEMYKFEKNNSYTKYIYSYSDMTPDDTADQSDSVFDESNIIEKGKYSMKDGIIHLVGGDEKCDIPYFINEYTHELVFDVDSHGNSQWTKDDQFCEWREQKFEEGFMFNPSLAKQ